MQTMFSHMLLLLPSAVCIVFFFRFLTSRSAHRTHYLLVLLSFLSVFYFYADAQHYCCGGDWRALAIAGVISAYTAPALPSLVIIFLRSIIFERYLRWYSLPVAFFLSFTLGAMTLTMYLMLGPEVSSGFLERMSGPGTIDLLPSCGMGRAESLHLLVTVTAYYAVCFSLCLLALWHIGYYMRGMKLTLRDVAGFLLHGGDIEPVHVEGVLFVLLFSINVIRMAVFRHFTMDHQWVGAVFSVIFAVLAWLIFHVGLYVERPTISLSGGTSHADTQEENPGGLDTVTADLAGETSATGHAAGDDPACDSLLAVLQQHMAEERPYLSASLSIEDLATTLCTNKTYLSRCINTRLHMTFRDYINSLRIAYSKEMMLSHPDYSQDAIAVMSGFTDAPSFNRRFRRVMDVTPRQWMLSQGR